MYQDLLFTTWALCLIGTTWTFVRLVRALGWTSPFVLMYGVGALGPFTAVPSFLGLPLVVFGYELDFSASSVAAVNVLTVVSVVALLCAERAAKARAIQGVQSIVAQGLFISALIWCWSFLVSTSP